MKFWMEEVSTHTILQVVAFTEGESNFTTSKKASGRLSKFQKKFIQESMKEKATLKQPQLQLNENNNTNTNNQQQQH